MDILLKLLTIIISSIIVLFLFQYSKTDNILVPVVLILCFYVILYTIVKNIQFSNNNIANNSVNNSVNNISNNSVNNSVNNIANNSVNINDNNKIVRNNKIVLKEEKLIYEEDSNNNDTTKLVYPINGPLDNLMPDCLIKNLNKINKLTAHPLKSKSNKDIITYDDRQVLIDNNHAPHSVKHEKVTDFFYPQLTKNHINANDCTNYGVDSPLSCNQPADNKNLFPQYNNEKNISILVDGLKTEDDLKQVIKEDFSFPLEILNNSKYTTIYKNSPSNPNILNRDVSDDLCRGCKVGKCVNSICSGNL